MTNPKIEVASILSQAVLFICACIVLDEFLKLSYDFPTTPTLLGKVEQ